MYINAEFPANIDSLELYEMIKDYNLNVTDIKTKIYMYGEVPARFMSHIITICSKFSYKEKKKKNPTS